MSHRHKYTTYNLTLRRRDYDEIPTTRDEWNTYFPHETFAVTEKISLTLPPIIGSLENTDSDGYYLKKRGPESLLLNGVKYQNMTLKEALCGFSLEIPHLSGKMLRISHSATSHVIKPNEKKPIPGYGMVKNGQTGNLIIDFDISFPDKLTEEQIKVLQNIL
jgi:hypothetical protein